MRLIINNRSITIKWFILCVIDVLLLPYIKPLHCSITMLILICWSLKHFDQILKCKYIMIMAVSGCISVLVGCLFFGTLSGVTPLVITIFAMLLVRYLDGNINTLNIAKIFEVYLYIATAFAILYLLFPQLYFDIRSLFTMNDTEIVFSNRLINRYTFIFSDPNNAACSFVAVLLYIVLFSKLKTMKLALVVLTASLCTLSTFSRTGIVLLAVAFITLLILKSTNRKRLMLIMLLLTLCGLLAVLLFGSTFIDQSTLYYGVISRFKHGGFASVGGRSSYWQDTIQNALSWYNIFIGKGAVIDSSLNLYTPHNGHLVLLVSYGLLSNIAFYCTFLRFNKRCVLNSLAVLMPLFAAFTINSGVADYRFMMIYALLVASVNARVPEEDSQRAP